MHILLIFADMNKLIIAIDGPSASGKSTTARLVAEQLGYIYIDTGAMYRAATVAWLRSGLEVNDDAAPKLMDSIFIELKQSPDGQRTFLNGEDVSDAIRLPEVTKLVSPVSALALVREKLVEQQRAMGAAGGVVMDGRDIGTVVFPDAELKIFLIASIEARAERRAKELSEKGLVFSLEEIKQQLAARDAYDSGRAISPLKKAQDAIEIDTSDLTIGQQVNKIIDLAKQKIK